MNLQIIKISLICIFLQLSFFGCKSSQIINLEAAVDEYLYLEKQTPLNMKNIEILKSKFEKINLETIDKEVMRLYYLSEIALIQNKPKEAYEFISKAYKINHADSIYKQKEKINSTMMNQMIAKSDSTNTNILWFDDWDNQMLMIDFNKTSYSNNNASNKTQNNLKINDIMNKGRNEVQTLYDNKKYESAINKIQMLIMIVDELNKNNSFNLELSQLYQDLSILYAKNNKLELAKETIQKAINLNPNQQNKEIAKLLNNN